MTCARVLVALMLLVSSLVYAQDKSKDTLGNVTTANLKHLFVSYFARLTASRTYDEMRILVACVYEADAKRANQTELLVELDAVKKALEWERKLFRRFTKTEDQVAKAFGKKKMWKKMVDKWKEIKEEWIWAKGNVEKKVIQWKHWYFHMLQNNFNDKLSASSSSFNSTATRFRSWNLKSTAFVLVCLVLQIIALIACKIETKHCKKQMMMMKDHPKSPEHSSEATKETTSTTTGTAAESSSSCVCSSSSTTSTTSTKVG